MAVAYGLRCRLRHPDSLPLPGERLVLDVIDVHGVLTGQTVRVVVEAARGPGSTTGRMAQIAALREPPHLCVCGHVHILHDRRRGPCSLCGEEACPLYRPKDPREEPP